MNRYPDDVPIIVRDGWIFIILGLLLTAGLWWIAPAAGVMGFVATLFVAWFFRDPRRESPAGEGLLLAPADGRVILVSSVAGDPDTGPGTMVSIFMNVFNVHVNRAPLSGTVTAVRHVPGAFLAADRMEAPLANERMEVVVRGGLGSVKFVQIAGLIARRIVCRLSPGDAVTSGQRYGLIKFGSRVDVYLPQAYELRLAEGDRTVAGVTVLASARTEKA